MKKIILLLLILISSWLSAKERILVDCIQGSRYYVHSTTGEPIAIDFQSLFPDYDVIKITGDSISFDELLIDEYKTGPQNLDYTVNLPDIVLPESPIALYVIVSTETDQILQGATGIITNPKGEIVSELYDSIGHYDGASGADWGVQLTITEAESYHIKIGYGPLLYASAAYQGQYNLNDYDLGIRIKDNTYYALIGITQEYSSYDLAALSDAFDNDFAFLNIYNFHNPFIDKPFIHFTTEADQTIDLAINFRGRRTVAGPLPESRGNEHAWNNFRIQPDKPNEIIYEGVLQEKLNLIHFNIVGNVVTALNQCEYPLQHLNLIRYKDVDTWEYGYVEKLDGNQQVEFDAFELYSTAELKDLLQKQFYQQAINYGLKEDEAGHLVYDFYWIESLLHRAFENKQHYFGFYHFNGELYDRIIPYKMNPLPEKVSRNMWVMLSNIQNREQELPVTLEKRDGVRDVFSSGLEMREYGVADEYYSFHDFSREDEFFGVELNNYVDYWMGGSVYYYDNLIANEISQDVGALSLIEGYYTFSVADYFNMGVLYDVAYPLNPLVAAVKVNDTGSLIALGTSWLFNDNPAHTRFLNNCVYALLHSPYFVEAVEEQVSKPNQIMFSSYPNPFNPETTIYFTAKNAKNAKVEIYNIKGQKVKTFPFSALCYSASVTLSGVEGQYSVTWNGRDDIGKPVASGLYFMQLKVDGKARASRKMLLLK